MNDFRSAVPDVLAWHERSYEAMRSADDQVVDYLGLSIAVPHGVFAPTPVSDLLGAEVLSSVRPGERVLDMGTGSGINALLAASRGATVTAVDVNPAAVAAATANAERNGLSDRVTFAVSDVFSAVTGEFDLMVIDPPFRWFTPRDLMEAAMADENYTALRTFVTSAASYLAPGGRILMFFGTSGDLDHLYRLVDENGFRRETVASRSLGHPDTTVWYHTLLLTRAA